MHITFEHKHDTVYKQSTVINYIYLITVIIIIIDKNIQYTKYCHHIRNDDLAQRSTFQNNHLLDKIITEIMQIKSTVL